jgi:DNA-binding PadR family transcriptional regulator
MDGHLKDSTGAYMNPSVLDLYILSLLDRGLQSPYDLLSMGGLSLGSAVPALRRLQAAGLVKKKASAGLSKRPLHRFQLSASGKKLARRGWIPLMKNQPPSDLEAVLRLVDVAQHNRVKPARISAFLEVAAARRDLPVSLGSGIPQSGEADGSLGLMVTRASWDATRLKTEAKFLRGLAKSVVLRNAKSPKL